MAFIFIRTPHAMHEKHKANDGRANYPVLAPRLKSLLELQGHSLMIHLDGDNHQDHPALLGGGGARLACGVIR